MSTTTTPDPVADFRDAMARAPAIDELKAQGARFVGWRWETRNGNRTKPPINPHTGGYADTTDPNTWADLGTAMAAVERYRLDGVGFVFDAERDNIVGSDLDGCRDPATGAVAAWATKIVRNINSYTEVSPSGTGLKIWTRVDPVPKLKANKRTIGKANGSKPPGVEIYTTGRYFCITGQIFDDVPDEIVDATPAMERLAAWVAKVKPAPELPAAFGALLEHDDRLKTAWTNGTKLGGGGDTSASGLDFSLARYLRRHLDNADLEAVLRAHPHGQIGGGRLKSKVADRRVAQIIAEIGPRPDGKAEGEAGEEPVIIDPVDPYETAAIFLERQHRHEDGRTLQRHRGSFYVYAGGHYREMQAEELRKALYGFLANAKVRVRLKTKGNEPADELVIPFKPSRDHVTDLVDTVKARAAINDHLAMPCWLGDGPGPGAVIPMANGLLELATGSLLPHSPGYFQSYSLAFDYDPQAPEPVEWFRFLESLWPKDQEAIDTLQEVMGLLLTDDTSHHKLFMLVGPPRSGKGTIARVIQRLHGKENIAGPTLSGLATNFGLQELIGKPVAIISDARLSGRADTAVVTERLLSISGEDCLTIDRKHRDPWTGTLPTRFLILTNELPKIADASGALASRFVILILTKSFLGREDHKLLAKLTPELSAIFNWALAGSSRLERSGYFVMPKSSQDAVEEITTLSSPILAFIRDRCVIAPAAETPAKALYEQWRAWCAEQGRDRPGSVQAFGNDLRSAVPHLKKVRPRDGEIQRTNYRGVRLRTEDDQCP